MVELSKILYLWEQFKEEADKAVAQSQSTGTKWHLVFVPSLKQFDATNNPKTAHWLYPADEIIITYGEKDDVYSPQIAAHENLITTFTVWIQYNGHRLETDHNIPREVENEKQQRHGVER